MIHVARLSLQGDVIVAIGGKPIAGQSMDAVHPGKPVLLHDLLPLFEHWEPSFTMIDLPGPVDHARRRLRKPHFFESRLRKISLSLCVKRLNRAESKSRVLCDVDFEKHKRREIPLHDI